MLARAIITMAAPHWLGLFGLVLLGWAARYLMAIPAELRSLSRLYGGGICPANPGKSAPSTGEARRNDRR